MPYATMTSKGQITVPRSIRERLHLRAGKRLEFKVTKEGNVQIAPISLTVDDVFGILKRPGQRSYTVEEMNQALAERFRRQAI
jgi:AbrB family looped-hinge helix DNA binding protein